MLEEKKLPSRILANHQPNGASEELKFALFWRCLSEKDDRQKTLFLTPPPPPASALFSPSDKGNLAEKQIIRSHPIQNKFKTKTMDIELSSSSSSSSTVITVVDADNADENIDNDDYSSRRMQHYHQSRIVTMAGSGGFRQRQNSQRPHNSNNNADFCCKPIVALSILLYALVLIFIALYTGRIVRATIGEGENGGDNDTTKSNIVLLNSTSLTT